MTTPEAPQPGSSSQDNMNETLAGLQVTMTSILASISNISQRMDRLEAPEPIIVAPDINLTPGVEHIAAQGNVAGTQVAQNPTTHIITPAHLVPPNIRKDILEGKDVNLISLLIASQDVMENKTFNYGDLSVVMKARDPRLSKKLTIPEFVLAFGIYRDVVCTSFPHRREELDLHLHKLVDLGHKYGGHTFFEYHKSFSAKAAAALVQFNIRTDWRHLDTELFCRYFAGLVPPSCAICASSSHSTNLCPNKPSLPTTSYAAPVVIHYLDDFLTVEKQDTIPHSINKTVALFKTLGVPVAENKTMGPTTKLTFLGIDLDSAAMQVSLPADKVQRIRVEIGSFLDNGTTSRKDLQSLLGSLNFAMRIIPQGRAFISRLLRLLPDLPNDDSRVTLDSQARADLTMWHHFLSDWNGRNLFIPPLTLESPLLWTDAAGQTGFAAIFGNRWLRDAWPSEAVGLPAFTKTSALFEIYPIVAAAKVWGHLWGGKAVKCYSDNTAACEILNKGRSSSLIIMSLVSGTQAIDVIEQGAGAHPDGPQIPVASDSDSCSSPDDKLATLEKQLEDEYKVKSEAEKLIKAYSTGRSKDQKHLSDAQKILHDSKIKIEILRMLILQHKATPAISPLEKRIEELSHRFVIERAVAEGAKHAIQKLDGKPLVEAQSILQASNEKLSLLKYSLEERVKELPDGHHRKSITTEELSFGSVKSKSIALTGTLKVRVKGCHGILENVPGRLKIPSDVLPGRSPRRGRFFLMNRIRRNNRGSNPNIQETFGFSKYRRLDSFDESKLLELCVKLIDEPLYLLCEVRTQLKIDQIPVGSTSWKTVSNPSWNKTFKLDLDKSRELEISLYWHDQRSLCATKTLKLEEFLLNPKQELCLQLEPQGTLFIKVTFSSPFTQKRPKLQTIRKLISTKQEETTKPAPLEDAAIDAHSLPESYTESVESSAPTVDPETERTIQPAPEEDVVTDSPILPVESMHPLTPDVYTITEEPFQPPPVEATKIDNVPVADTEIVESSPPAIITITAEAIQPPQEEARIMVNAPLPVEDSVSMEPSPQAIVSLLEMTIQPALEEDLVTDTTPLPVEDTDSMEPSVPAVDEITEKTIQPPPEEDAAINADSLPVEDSESVEPLPPAVEDTEKIIQPAPEEAVVIDTPQVPAVDNEKVESSPPAADDDMENNIQTPTEKDAVIDVDNIVEEAIGPPKGLVYDTVPLAEADVENPSSSAGIQHGARLSIQDFDCLCVLGRGAFGKVLLVEYKRTKIKYALKAQKKQGITGTQRVPRLICEKEILQTVSEVQHPFLVNMLASFQTQDHFCFLMEYAAGGDLMTSIRNNNFQPFSTTRAVFYAACCVLGLEFLHQNDIVHRDLKLANIVIDVDGFAKITDFGVSKQGMGYGDEDRTYCGTLHYMAPEMVSGKPYTTSIDWWSLGAVIYIMLCGKYPFPGDVRQVRYNIVYSTPHYPRFLTAEARSILRSLLNKDPEDRLGASENGAWDLKSHPFFEQIEWFALLFKSVRPPCVPSIEGPDDIRYFNRMYTSCAPILTPPGESKSLSDVELELFKDFDWVSDRI
ncbi:serine/threonine-protein kinase N2-like [Pelobates fuscus]|uniref:serine/threonine-protein kinase N2-like n=1 Tax=Pelobates fuscus TaxID=191477 RepID=UPI002FE4E2FF